MITKRTVLLVFLIFLVFPFLMGISRRPAVEPVTGISIDNLQTPPTSKFVGFDFSSGKPKDLRPQSYRKVRKVSADSEDKGMSPAYFVIFLAFLPLAVWFGIMKKIRQDEISAIPNAVDFKAYQERRQKVAAEAQADEKEKSKISKAS